MLNSILIDTFLCAGKLMYFVHTDVSLRDCVLEARIKQIGSANCLMLCYDCFKRYEICQVPLVKYSYITFYIGAFDHKHANNLNLTIRKPKANEEKQFRHN